MPASLSATVAGLLDQYRAPLEESDERILADQIALAHIPAPTSHEQERAAWVAASCEACGLVVERDEVGNVVASLDDRSPPNAPPVIVCAHLDTVFDLGVEHRVTQRGTRYVGPGIGDNARGLAAMLAIARTLARQGPRTSHPIVFAATVGEEGDGDLRGARHLFAARGSRAHAAFALDGAGDERVVTHALGSRRFRVRLTGPGGHSWAASDTPNPLHAVADLAAQLTRLPLRSAPRTTLAVTRMNGGHAVNAIPASASLDVEIRSPHAWVLASGESELRALVAAALAAENARRGASRAPLTATVDVVSDRPAGVAPLDALPVRAAVAATERIGRTPEFAIASTDANVPLSLGIPAVTLGAGGVGGDTHTTGEWFENRDGASGVLRALAAIVAVASTEC